MLATIYLDDTHVEVTNPNTNFGSEDYMQVGQGNDGTYNPPLSRGWLKGDLSSLAGLKIAAASGYVGPFYVWGTDYRSFQCELQRCTNVAWTKYNITFNNAPDSAVTEEIFYLPELFGSNNYLDLNFRDAVVNALPDNAIAIRVKELDEGYLAYGFFSSKNYTSTGCSKIIVLYNQPTGWSNNIDDYLSNSVPWHFLENLGAEDGTVATNGVSADDLVSSGLKFTDFGFDQTIPTGSTINSITVTAKVMSDVNDANSGMIDNIVKLVINGSASGANKATTGKYSTSLTTKTWTWTTSLPTVAQIRASNFGVAYSSKLTGTAIVSQVVSMDYLKMDIDFTPPPPGASPLQLMMGN
jgi:hypothetical protein